MLHLGLNVNHGLKRVPGAVSSCAPGPVCPFPWQTHHTLTTKLECPGSVCGTQYSYTGSCLFVMRESHQQIAGQGDRTRSSEEHAGHLWSWMCCGLFPLRHVYASHLKTLNTQDTHFYIKNSLWFWKLDFSEQQNKIVYIPSVFPRFSFLFSKIPVG